jgi:hypothetical protein
MVSAKAEKLLAVIQAKGGGILDEYLLRDKTGLSHGSIVAGRKELEMAGLLQLTKQGRKLYYTLTGQNDTPLTGQPPVAVSPANAVSPAGGSLHPAPPAVSPAPAETQAVPSPPPASDDTSTATPAMAEPPNSDSAAAFLPAMPHIAGTFYDFDEWTDALMNALGACIYISESLTGDGTYTVYSHEYEGEDTYLTETTEDGFIVQ